MKFIWKQSTKDKTHLTQRPILECLGYIINTEWDGTCWTEHPDFGCGGEFHGTHALKNAKGDCRKHFNTLNKKHQRKLIKKYSQEEGACMQPQ